MQCVHQGPRRWMGPQAPETERELITYVSGLTWIIAKGKIFAKLGP